MHKTISLFIFFSMILGLQVTELHGMNLENELVKFLGGEIKFEINVRSHYAGMYN